MKNKTNRKKYSNDFKRNAIEFALSGEQSCVEIARKLDLNVNTLYKWKSEYNKKCSTTIENNEDEVYFKKDKYMEERLRTSEKECQILSESLFILMKENNFFTKYLDLN